MINKSHTENFKTLCDAVKSGDICIMECKRKKDNVIIPLICAVNREKNGDYTFVPLGEMINCDPYENYFPPDPNGDNKFFEE